MKAFFVSKNRHSVGIRHESGNSMLHIGDPRGIHTPLAVAESLRHRDLLTDIATRIVRRNNDRSGDKCKIRIIPSTPENRNAILLVSLTFKSNLRWQSIHDGIERYWRIPCGTANNDHFLWRGVRQIAYGERVNRFGHLTVSRLITLEARSGFVVQRNGLGFCVYWNGFTLDRTPLMPMQGLNARIASVLDAVA